MTNLELKIKNLANESFRSKSDLYISNEGVIFDYISTYFSPFSYIFNKILHSEKQYKKTLEEIRTSIYEKERYDLKYLIPDTSSSKLTSKDVIKELEGLLNKYKKLNISNQLKIVEQLFHDLIKHIKTVWVYNNFDDVAKVYSIKENIYKEIYNMFTTDSFRITRGKIELQTITAFSNSTKVELSIDVKNDSLVKDLNTKYVKKDSSENVDFVDCYLNDKNKIISLCRDLLNELEYIYTSLITFSRKMESLLGYVTKERILNITLPFKYINLFGVPIRVDLRTAMNVCNTGNDVRVYIDYVFTDIMHVIKAACYYAK